MNYDIDTLVAIKSSFQANDFQWIKTTDRTKLGKVVQVRDVVPGRNGRFVAILSDGSQMDTDMVSSNLMMITEDQPAMSFAEIESINYIPSLTEDIKVAQEIPQEFANEVKTVVTTQPTATPVANVQAPIDTNDLFGMFELEETLLALTVKVKLPSKNLLKMMYTNSKDKEDFLNKLSNYINSNVTVDAIKSYMEKTLGSTAKSKSMS